MNFGDSFWAGCVGRDTTSKLNHVYGLKVKRLRFALETTFYVTLERDLSGNAACFVRMSCFTFVMIIRLLANNVAS